MADLPKEDLLIKLQGSQELRLPNGAIADRQDRFLEVMAAVRAAAANSGKGWAFIDDSKTDQTDAIDIPANTRASISIDGLGPLTQDDLDTIPRSHALMAGGAFMPVQFHDNYLLRFRFKAMVSDMTTEGQNFITTEFQIGQDFVIHEDRLPFIYQEGVARARANDLAATATALGGVLGAALGLLSSQKAAADAELAAMQGTVQQFTSFDNVFVGSTFLANGLEFYVTPTVDIKLWAPSLLVTRLSSPTT